MKTFGELTKSEKMAIFEAYLDGAPIERFTIRSKEWIYTLDPAWRRDDCYRVQPTHPTINWYQVAPEYKWLAMDKSGVCYLYRTTPYIPHSAQTTWLPVGQRVRADVLLSFKPGTCDWKDSLVERPAE